MWAGLLASSCTPDGKDESNLIYIDLLSKLTSSEVALVNYLFNHTKKGWEKDSLIYAYSIDIDMNILQTISGFEDVHVQETDRIIRHLESLGLVTFTSVNDTSMANLDYDGSFSITLTPTTLCLNMYVKCQGSSGYPVEYWREELPPTPSLDGYF
ncbi:hypothetical protein LI82_04110 [Methanococcoides methylutens]|uniref:Uncharacterized protein n=2 Tax=Methanococcoides methylutens TaxID=2226 RepID=A0A099T224_METMT|nr:hypothetical protein LI82_04110 [Methanococcoides methylutens]